MTAFATDGRADFDFFHGRWQVHHRRLQTRLRADTRWDEFAGTCETRPILDGVGNMDDNVLELPADTYRAVTIRLFKPATRLWSIWWIDGRDPGLQSPVHGSFRDGVGTFFGDDTFEDQPIRVRFIWSDITATSARWQQAFSPDGGATWETNWYMRFKRAS